MNSKLLKTNSEFKIIYIVSVGHSGSTLLDLLVSSHSQVTSGGELKMLCQINKKDRGSKQLNFGSCTCGVRPLKNCSFWRQINDSLIEHNLSLDSLEVDSLDKQVFKVHNELLFKAIAKTSRCNWIVDSSKTGNRLAHLIEAGFDVYPINLIRVPHGVVYSNVKLGRKWLTHTVLYAKHHIGIQMFLRGIYSFSIHYEKLANNPKDELNKLMNYLNLDFEEEQLAWNKQEHHNFEGNPMRFIKDLSLIHI